MNTCGFCKVPCNNEWCPSNDSVSKAVEGCKEDEVLKSKIQEIIGMLLELTEK